MKLPVTRKFALNKFMYRTRIINDTWKITFDTSNVDIQMGKFKII